MEVMKYKQLTGIGWATAFVLPLIILGYIPLLNGILIPFFALLLLIYRLQLEADSVKLSVPIWLLIIITGLFLAIYRPHEFSYPLVFSTVALHEGGNEFRLHINTTKTLAGYLVLYFLINGIGSRGKTYLKLSSHQFATSLICTFLILATAFLVLDLDIYPKPIAYVLAFGLVNLLVTCVSEEAFMRLVFQSQLERFISKYTNKTLIYQGVSLFITTVLFVTTHAIASVELFIVFSIAGFLYGLIYTLTKNVFASIATHFTVNILHFSFLTYPL